MKLKILFFITIIFLVSFNMKYSYTIEPEEVLKDKKLELRAREISKSIRCMICQNQSIDDSNSQIAKDLRILIRKKITDGKNDKEIYKFLTDRYGDFILLKPPFNIKTLALWFLPFIFFVLGVLVLLNRNIKSRKY
tara:strand:- start:688 stop:1095 length:408 start_codon:yes stop_codon:yes gene_type:complete